MNLYAAPHPLYWAEQAGEDRARSRMWMDKARAYKSMREAPQSIAECVRHARSYHREYRRQMREAFSYLQKHTDKVKISASVADRVFPGT